MDSFGFYPDDQMACPYDIKMFAYQGWMVYNSKLDRFASVSFSGSILEIYQLQKKPSLIQKYHDLYPMYRNKSIAKTIKTNIKIRVVNNLFDFSFIIFLLYKQFAC